MCGHDCNFQVHFNIANIEYYLMKHLTNPGKRHHFYNNFKDHSFKDSITIPATLWEQAAIYYESQGMAG